MGLIRLLLLIAIGILLFLALRNLLRRAGPRAQAPQPPGYVPMVSCMGCGLHLPRSNAIERDGRYYCCREHADQAGR